MFVSLLSWLLLIQVLLGLHFHGSLKTHFIVESPEIFYCLLNKSDLWILFCLLFTLLKAFHMCYVPFTPIVLSLGYLQRPGHLWELAEASPLLENWRGGTPLLLPSPKAPLLSHRMCITPTVWFVSYFIKLRQNVSRKWILRSLFTPCSTLWFPRQISLIC